MTIMCNDLKSGLYNQEIQNFGQFLTQNHIFQ
jgi:hypothetical protein